jgi:hypothetical protein
MSRVGLGILVIIAMFGAGCGYSSHSMGGAGAPSITSLGPNMATAGDPGFILTVNGSGFGTDSVVFWNGMALPSTYGTGTQVTATVSGADIMSAGMFPVSVRSGGMNSNMMNFTVQ